MPADHDPDATVRTPAGDRTELDPAAAARARAAAHAPGGLALPPHLELVRPLGEGGMGAVYLVVERRSGRRLALKTLRAGAPSPEMQARFLAEARAAAKLAHPDIISCTDLGSLESGEPYYAMPVLAGKNLGEALPGWDPETRARAARAVGFAHRAGILHRDLKPANIMVGEAGELWVVDWGLARLEARGQRLEDKRPEAAASTLGLTQAGQMMGTLGYMPPEQAAGDLAAIGPPADVHALGAILYQALAGTPPYAGDTWVALLQAMEKPIPPPPARLPWSAWRSRRSPESRPVATRTGTPSPRSLKTGSPACPWRPTA